MSLANYPNVEKLARVFDWALGVIFSLLLIGLLLFLIIMIIVLIL